MCGGLGDATELGVNYRYARWVVMGGEVLTSTHEARIVIVRCFDNEQYCSGTTSVITECTGYEGCGSRDSTDKRGDRELPHLTWNIIAVSWLSGRARGVGIGSHKKRRKKEKRTCEVAQHNDSNSLSSPSLEFDKCIRKEAVKCRSSL